MLAAPARDWNVFKQICAEPWEGFTHAHPRDQTADEESRVAKRLACGHPEPRGDGADRGLHGGPGPHRVAMRCQAAVCLRCANVSVDHGVRQGSQRLHEGGLSRHLSLTVPARFRTPFSHHAPVVWSALRRCGGQGLDAFVSEVRGQARRGGAIGVPHTQGRQGPSPPQRQVLAPSGGDDGQEPRWAHGPSGPEALRRRTWPWPRLTRRRQPRKSEASHRWVDGGVRP
jgi:hypothetical protein